MGVGGLRLTPSPSWARGLLGPRLCRHPRRACLTTENPELTLCGLSGRHTDVPAHDVHGAARLSHAFQALC
eukprot:9023567-Alexandrium_andersonii.AAC.1